MKNIVIPKGVLRLLPLFFALFLFYGCSDGKHKKVDKIVVVKGGGQCVMPGEMCSEDLVIELESQKIKGLFGGKGSRYPVTGVKVLFVPVDGSDLKVIPSEAESDAGGGVRVKVRAGKAIGDQYIKAIPVGFEKAAEIIRITCGVKIKGGKQEGRAGSYLKSPLEIKIVNSSGDPVEGAPVYFHISGTPEKKKARAACKPESVLTDATGQARTKIKIGGKTGTYKVTAEVMDKKNGIFIRGIEIPQMGLDLSSLIMTVLGGLAFFIYGMKTMSDGLQLVAGHKMKSILHFFTSNRFVAVAAGALVTAVIQSSSACTVMVVGFVNAGLLSLSQAIGIIFGANIGTTITAQMISFKLGWLALPAIILGLFVIMVGKSTLLNGWGKTLFGFGLLFFGMGLMGNELKLIGKFPSFVAFFKSFDCTPVNGYMPIGAVLGAIGIGTLMTVLIQSSSASIGIVLALAGSGLINFYTAVPLILGDNIGTTITAVLAGLAANKPAKQTAVAHVLFNVLGAAVMIILFYVRFPGTDCPFFLYAVDSVTNGNVFAQIPQNLVRHIAMSHTMFNVINVIVFLPFIGVIAKLCTIIVKIEEPVKLHYLEPHLLNTPSIALEQSVNSIRYMVKEAWKMVEMATNKSFMKGKTEIEMTSHLARREEKIDKLQQDITDYLVELTRRKLTEPQSSIIPLLMHCTNDAEKIADHTENILSLSKRLEEAKHKISKSAKEELRELWGNLSAEAENVMRALNRTDKDNIDLALYEEEKINRAVDELEKRHIKRLQKGECNPVVGIIFIEMLSELEKIGDHLSNIAERTPEMQRHHINLRYRENI